MRCDFLSEDSWKGGELQRLQDITLRSIKVECGWNRLGVANKIMITNTQILFFYAVKSSNISNYEVDTSLFKI